MTLSVRRSVAVLALGAALVTTGCGATSADRAATVDGTVISESELQTTMREVNAMEPALLQSSLSPSGTLTALVQAPVVLELLAGKGIAVSDSVARRTASERGLADPSEGALEIVRLATAIGTAQQGGQITEADAATLQERLGALDVTINPRYGRFDPQTASVQLTQPGWITSTDAPQ
ncbi:hypothetical protein [Oryzobacter terrae]|uniref:hypothetical protein n=1 Tax=Oryzobacter terrae TaxID=1620385 RepID=UPI00366A9EFC